MSKPNDICPNCHTHTEKQRIELGNGRYKLRCIECEVVMPIVFDKDNKEIPKEQLKKESELWP